MCVYVWVSVLGVCPPEVMSTTFMQIPTERPEGIIFPGTPVIDNFEPSYMFITKCRIFARLVSFLNC